MSRSDRYVQAANAAHERRVALRVWQRTTSPTREPLVPDLDAYERGCVALAARLLVESPGVPLGVVRSRYTTTATALEPLGLHDRDAASAARLRAWEAAVSSRHSDDHLDRWLAVLDESRPTDD